MQSVLWWPLCWPGFKVVLKPNAAKWWPTIWIPMESHTQNHKIIRDGYWLKQWVFHRKIWWFYDLLSEMRAPLKASNGLVVIFRSPAFWRRGRGGEEEKDIKHFNSSEYQRIFDGTQSQNKNDQTSKKAGILFALLLVILNQWQIPRHLKHSSVKKLCAFIMLFEEEKMLNFVIFSQKLRFCTMYYIQRPLSLRSSFTIPIGWL